jgi:hypothetical protein
MHVCTAISAIGDVVAEVPLLVDSIETCHRSPGPGETLYLAASDAMMVRASRLRLCVRLEMISWGAIAGKG